VTSTKDIRLFVSSTFADMQAERDALARYCFPDVRQAYLERGGSFSEIDLRWGIPIESSEENILLSCVDEIEQCEGCFVGILGSRYGWVPDAIPDSVSQATEAELLGKSVTEMEIHLGALNNKSTRFCAFFFRTQTSAQEDPRLTALKELIKCSGHSVGYFQDPSELASKLAQALLEHLTSFADNDVALAQPQPYGQGRMRPDFEKAIRRFVQDSAPVLFVEGPEGSGKTHQIASWLAKSEERVPAVTPNGFNRLLQTLSKRYREDLWISYFVSQRISRSQVSDLLNFLIRRFEIALQLRESLPLQAMQDRIQRLQDLTSQACNKFSKIIVVVDGIDDLYLDEANTLAWMPTAGNLKLIVLGRTAGRTRSILPDESHVFQLEPLNSPELEQFLPDYFRRFGKTVPVTYGQGLVRHQEVFSRPSTLCALAEEMRLAGSPEDLNEVFESLVCSISSADLFEKIFRRLESELGRPLIQLVVGLLTVSRGGLLPQELQGLVSVSYPISVPVWSALKRWFTRSWFLNDGYLGIYSAGARFALEKVFDLHDLALVRYRELLVDYFETKFHADRLVTQRMVDELPWQMLKLKRVQQLGVLLLEAGLLRRMCDLDAAQTLEICSLMKSESGAEALRALIEKSLRAAIDQGESTVGLLSLHHELGFVDNRFLHEKLTSLGVVHQETVGPGGFRVEAIESLNIARLLVRQGNAANAKGLLNRIKGRLAENPLDSSVFGVLESETGNCEMRLGNFQQAEIHFAKAVGLFESQGDRLTGARNRYNRAHALQLTASWKAALRELKEPLILFEKYQDLRALHSALLIASECYRQLGSFKIAAQHSRSALELARRLCDPHRISDSLLVHARVVEALGDFDEATELHCERISTYKSLRDFEGLARSMQERAHFMSRIGPAGNNLALKYLKEALQITRDHQLLELCKVLQDDLALIERNK
jgi:tetratricopeptide (TPR) repeat protein